MSLVSQKFLFAIMMMITLVALLPIYLLPAQPIVKTLFALLVLLLDMITFSTKIYTDFFMPFARMKNATAVIEEEEPFAMSPSGNAILVRKGSDIYASVFIKVPVYRSASEMTTEEKTDFARLFSRALTLSKQPVRFATQLYVINKDDYITNIRGKLDDAENRYQSASISSDVSKSQSERIRGEVTMWHNLFDNVDKVKSQSLEAFAMITAYGGSEEEATNLALQRADELGAGINSVFGVTTTVLAGEDLLKFIEPDHMIPVVTVSEQLREKSVAGGI